MKKLFTVSFILVVGFLVSSEISAQAKKKTTTTSTTKPTEMPKEAAPSPANPSQEEMMKVWEAYMTPGEQHRRMEKDNGTWMQEITMWMDPSAPPQNTTATAETSMIMGGRYQQSVTKGDFMGMPFEGISTVGYDNAKKVFFSTWIDNMGTGLTYMEGNFDPKENVFNFNGKMTDPMTGKDLPVREVFKVIDDNTQFFTMYHTKDGKEFKAMEIKMTRK